MTNEQHLELVQLPDSFAGPVTQLFRARCPGPQFG
jgi:hypothetical protein